VVAPLALFGTARAAYRRINETLIAGLAAVGAPAAIHPGGGGSAPRPSTVPCFAEPVEGEVLAAGRKLIGSAQVSADGVFLQHGSLPFRPSAFHWLLEKDPDAPSNDIPAYLESVTGVLPAWDDLVGALRSAWADVVGYLEESSLTDGERARVEELAPRYRASEWTWRR
jgi:lipoate-protein ligase A